MFLARALKNILLLVFPKAFPNLYAYLQDGQWPLHARILSSASSGPCCRLSGPGVYEFVMSYSLRFPFGWQPFCSGLQKRLGVTFYKNRLHLSFESYRARHPMLRVLQPVLSLDGAGAIHPEEVAV